MYCMGQQRTLPGQPAWSLLIPCFMDAAASMLDSSELRKIKAYAAAMCIFRSAHAAQEQAQSSSSNEERK